jgi:hypothetical protein
MFSHFFVRERDMRHSEKNYYLDGVVHIISLKKDAVISPEKAKKWTYRYKKHSKSFFWLQNPYYI